MIQRHMPGLVLAAIAFILIQVVDGWFLVVLWVLFAIGVFPLAVSLITGEKIDERPLDPSD